MPEDNTAYAVELFTQISDEVQEQIIALIQYLLTEQEQCPAAQQITD